MGWLSDYIYRKKVPVNSTIAGAQTNYQLKLKIGESSGASGYDVHLENHCQNFPNDIRFTGPDGATKHDYWIEETTGTTPNRTITVWIEVGSIPAVGSADLYVYYNKSSVANSSNGVTTFGFFDDFTETLKPDYVCSFGFIDSVEHVHGASLSKINSAIAVFNSWNPDFVVEVGDIIDDDTEAHDLTALGEVETSYDDLTMPRKYVFGNHDLDALTKATFMSLTGMNEKYHSFDVGDYHFIILDDMYDVSGNDIEAHGQSNPSRYISDIEKTWLTNDLSSTSKKTIVFVEAHLYGMPSTQMIQNASDIRTILENSNKVLACFHGHAGSNQIDTLNGITYYSMRAMDVASPNAYAKIAIYDDDSIRVEGISEQASYPFDATWTLGGDASFASDELQIGINGRAYATYSVFDNSCASAKVKISSINNRVYFVPYSESPVDDGSGAFDGMHYDLPLKSSKDWRLRHSTTDLIFGGNGSGVVLNIWHRMDLTKIGTSWKCILDTVEKGNTIYTYSASHLYVELGAYGTAGTVKYDNVFVRKYVSPEPTWGSWGAEEEKIKTEVDSGVKSFGYSQVDSGLKGISTEFLDVDSALAGLGKTEVDSGIKGLQCFQVDSGISGLSVLQAPSGIRGIVEDITFKALSGIKGISTEESDIDSALAGLAWSESNSGILGLASLKIGSGIIGGEADVFGFSYPLADPIPLRNTTVWGSFKDVQTIPHVYGRVRLTPIPYDNTGKLFVLADHGIQGVDEVQVDNEVIYAWKFRNTLDSSDSPVAMLELSEKLDSGSSLVVRIRGKVHPVSGVLLTNPADVLWDLLANVVGASILYADLDRFRVECSFHGIEVGGLLDDRERSIKKQLDIITESVGAIWSGGMSGLARLYPIGD